MQAEKAIEILIGSDRIVRINVDGICAYRTKVAVGCQFVVEDGATNEWAYCITERGELSEG